jgi:AcrR family transcriptional regulator
MFMNSIYRIDEKQKASANPSVRKLMLDATVQLLKEKPISKISVTDITEKAGVSRMSYYRNYSSKEEILTDHLDEIFRDYTEFIRKWDYKGSCFESPFLHKCFGYFIGHRDFLSTLLKSGMGDLLLKHLTDYIMDFFCPGDCGIVQYYKLQAFSGSIYSTYAAWQARNCKESLNDMAKIISTIYEETKSHV